MAKKNIPNYTVIKDTREQRGWIFNKSDRCDGMRVETLKTGDYTLGGFEEMVCVERKFSVEEIATNLGKKKKAFAAEMKRMREFPFKFIICEFTLEDLVNYPNSIFSDEMKKSRPEFTQSKIAERKVTGKYLLKALMEYQIWNGVHVLFCGDKTNGFYVASSIFKRLNEMFHE